MRRLGVTLAAAAVLCSVSGCATKSASISGAELMQALDTLEPPVILDVRSGWEYRRGHVPGALHIPFYSLFWQREQIAAHSGRPFVVYCAHGPRAGIAKMALRAAGVKDVRYLAGHMAAWKAQGRPLAYRSP